MGVATQHEYDQQASQYNKKRNNYLEHTHSKMMQLLENGNYAPSYVLEIGSGTGILAQKLSSLYPDIHYDGIELSHEMMRQQYYELPSGYQCINTDFLLYQTDRRYDLVISCSSLHFIDSSQALQKIYELLAPGGSVVILDRCNDGLFKIIDRGIRTFGSPESHTLSSQQIEDMCLKAGFEMKNHTTRRWKYRNLQSIVLQKAM